MGKKIKRSTSLKKVVQFVLERAPNYSSAVTREGYLSVQFFASLVRLSCLLSERSDRRSYLTLDQILNDEIKILLSENLDSDDYFEAIYDFVRPVNEWLNERI